MSRVLDIWFDTKRENIKAGSETQNDLAIFVIILSFLCMMGDFAHLAQPHTPLSHFCILLCLIMVNVKPVQTY